MRTILFFLLFCATGWAQDATTTLDTLRTSHDVVMAEMDLPLSEWHEKYLGQLKQLQAKVQQAGDLNQLLVIKQELEGGGVLIDPKYGDLKRLRGIYDRRQGQLEQAVAGKRRKAMNDYGRKLTALQGQLTQAGQIDEALKVKEEIDALTVSIGATPSRRTPGRMRQPGVNQRPGRLIIAGVRAGAVREAMILPESAKEKPFVRVFANGNQYYAVDAKGGVIGQPNNHNDHIVPKDLKPVVDIGMGTHISIMYHADGTMTPTPSAHHIPFVPDLDDVLKVSAGYSYNAALRRSGELVPFGYGLRESGFNNPRILTDVADIEVAGHWYIVRKKNGSFMAGKSSGEMWEDPPEGLQDIVQMAASNQGNCLFLNKAGEIISWRAPKPPDDLGPVRQIRAGRDAFGAQKADGSWVIWGDEDRLNRLRPELERLGPLKDFALGAEFFIAIK